MCGCGLVHIPHGGLRGNWARASSKTPHSHSLRSGPGVVQERPKTLCRSASAKKAYTGGGGLQRADGGHGHAGDRFPLPEWEPFAGSVAPVAERVQTDVDATMEALRQQHDIDVQAYKARIEHLETVLASLGIREPLELLPSTGGASTSRSVHDDQYTADMFTKISSFAKIWRTLIESMRACRRIWTMPIGRMQDSGWMWTMPIKQTCSSTRQWRT